MSRHERVISNERERNSKTRPIIDVMSKLYKNDLITPVGVHSIPDKLVNHDPLRVNIKQTLLIAWGRSTDAVSESVGDLTNVRVLDRTVYDQNYIQVRAWEKVGGGYKAIIVNVYPTRGEANREHQEEMARRNNQ